MPGNSFGLLFKITTFGESHGKAIGVVIDGCPAGVDIDDAFIQMELQRRRPGQSRITTSRKEDEEFEIVSGVFEGKSTGTPICILINNKDQRSADYESIKDKYRPSHADFTYDKKYGNRDYRGGGRSSARETASRVAAGAVSKMILKTEQIEVFAFVSQIGDIKLEKSNSEIDLNLIESNIVRCPDQVTADKMIALIEQIKEQGDTIGGIITCIIKNVPVGIGDPVFDKLHADLGKAMLSINAVKGFEIGSGFKSARMKGSEHNDEFLSSEKTITTKTNYSGGVQGGISNGMDIYFNIAFKPVATLMKSQKSIDNQGNDVTIQPKGRHDPCVLPRAVPIVEAMAAITLTDHLLRNKVSKI